MAPLKVPFYHQSHDFTCGPASLMMALAYFKPRLPMTQATEIDIWREATLYETRGTSRFGLALAAYRRGLGARTVCNVEDIVFKDRIVERYEDLDKEFLDFLFKDLKEKCLAIGMTEERDDVTVETIKGSLAKGEVPIIMCSTAMFLNEDIPHWIVVTGFEGKMVHVNNPLSDGPETVGLQMFEKNMGSRGNGALVAIFERGRKGKKGKKKR